MISLIIMNSTSSNKRYLRKSLLILLLLIPFFAGSEKTYAEQAAPAAKRGIINLSNWDFERDGIVKIRGEWEFYWNKFYSPSDFDTVKQKPEYIVQPTNWIVKKINGKNLPNFGYATYRIKIVLNRDYSAGEKKSILLGLKLIEAHASAKLWIDKNLMFENGTPSPDAGKFKPRVKPESAVFLCREDTVTVTINVANYFDTYMAGIDDHVLLGTEKQITYETKSKEYIYLISFSILFILSFYHLTIYLVRKKEKLNLYFAAACFIFSIQSFVIGEKPIYFFFPGLSTVLYYKIWLSTLLVFPFLAMFYRELFPDEISKNVIRSVQAVFGLNFLLVVFTKHSFYIALETYVLYFGFAIVLYLVYAMILAVKNKRPYSGFVLASMVIPFVTAINDIFFGLDWIVTGYYGPIGFLFLIISHSLLVIARFTKAYEKVEVLSGDLIELNKTLEQKVKERTNELNRAYDDLKETNATTNKIYSIIAHDLKNIFQTLIGYSDLIAMDTQEADMGSIADDAKTVKKAAQKAYLFFENMLEWSSSQTGMIKYNPEKLFVKQMIVECIELLSMQAKIKKITFSISASNDAVVFADKRMLNTILRNLVSNAVKFTYKGGKITIKTELTGECVEVCIKDTGIGMDKETVERLFIMDRMKSQKGTASETGTGLGLLLTKEFIEANKGRLKVESEPEKGSSFYFSLPVYKNQAG